MVLFPSAYPIKNNESLSLKRHVVFSKTIRCFLQNDTLFSSKRAVVFSKTIRRFGMRYNTKFEEGLIFWEGCPKKEKSHRLATSGIFFYFALRERAIMRCLQEDRKEWQCDQHLLELQRLREQHRVGWCQIVVRNSQRFLEERKANALHFRE